MFGSLVWARLVGGEVSVVLKRSAARGGVAIEAGEEDESTLLWG